MPKDIHDFFAILAGFVGLLALIPYIYATIFEKDPEKRTRPHRVSWFIWMILATVIAVDFEHLGAAFTVILAWVVVFNTTVCFALSLKYGEKGWGILEVVFLVAAVIAGIFWFFSPGWSLFMALTIDACGLVPTWKKTWLKPKSENLLGWELITVASVLNVLAIREYTLELAGYPIYAVVGCFSMVLVIRIRTSMTQARVSSG